MQFFEVEPMTWPQSQSMRVFVQGNCSADKLTPTGITLTNEINRNRGQCLVVTETDLFHLGDRAVWLDNLFLKIAFRSTTGDRSSKWPNLISVPPADTKQGERYVTRVTLEGDGVGPAGGLWADSDILIQGEKLISAAVLPACNQHAALLGGHISHSVISHATLTAQPPLPVHMLIVPGAMKVAYSHSWEGLAACAQSASRR